MQETGGSCLGLVAADSTVVGGRGVGVRSRTELHQVTSSSNLWLMSCPLLCPPNVCAPQGGRMRPGVQPRAFGSCRSALMAGSLQAAQLQHHLGTMEAGPHAAVGNDCTVLCHVRAVVVIAVCCCVTHVRWWFTA